MGRVLVCCSTTLLAAACNQVFGLDPTRPQDAGLGEPAIDAPPPILVVQSQAIEVIKAKSNVLAFSQPVTAGNAIFVGVYTESAVVASVTDTLGSTYTNVVGPIALPSSGANLYIYASVGVAGGDDTVTVTVTPDQATSPSIEVYMHELSYVVAVDGGTGMAGSSQAPDGTTSGAIQTHGSNELILGFGVADTVVAAGTGFVTFSTYDNNLTEGLVVTAPGSYAATGTSTGRWAMLVAAFAGP